MTPNDFNEHFQNVLLNIAKTRGFSALDELPVDSRYLSEAISTLIANGNGPRPSAFVRSSIRGYTHHTTKFATIVRYQISNKSSCLVYMDRTW